MAPFINDTSRPPSSDEGSLPLASSDYGITISIDRGGTFCDAIAKIPGREPLTLKLLSQDPKSYPDAPTEAIRRVLEIAEGRQIPVGQKLDGSKVASCRIGTTVATNALLEHKGEKFAFITTKGFRDICAIGDQTRPKIFALKVEKSKVIHDAVYEVEERVTLEDYDLNPSPIKDLIKDDQDVNLVKTKSGEVVRVLQRIDPDNVRDQLVQVQSAGYTSVAIALMFSHIFPDHEKQVAEIALGMGFRHVFMSHEAAPYIKLLRRATSVCSEAYLYPVIRDYVDNFESGFSQLPQRVEFMCSDGGLKQARKFRGNEALLSGPAGGVVGIARSCFDAVENTPLIGFDMGGTSTDVCRFDGKYDYLSESRIAGRNISVPMLNIQTVAAGGGSILFARSGLLVVGPESAGAYPGPACYRNGGPLTVTDANLFLGRLDASSFPAIFGKNADEPLDLEVVKIKFAEITTVFNKQTCQDLKPVDVALGFLKVANESMSRPIRNTTEARGYIPEKHNLVSFGGAGGQHACAIAETLGIRRILIHKWSSLLSAYGISQAQLQYEVTEPLSGVWSTDELPRIRDRVQHLKSLVNKELASQGAAPKTISYDVSLSLQYSGTDTILDLSQPKDEDYGKAFIAEHLREFAFNLDRKIIINSVKVRGQGFAGILTDESFSLQELEQVKKTAKSTLSVHAKAVRETDIFFSGQWVKAAVCLLKDLEQGCVVRGPALLLDDTQTILIEPDFTAYILKDHVVIERNESQYVTLAKTHGQVEATPSPIQLSVFAHRFMSIAEQMGNTLQRTSISTSIRERLDFSCAIFSPDGQLVANAPHIPIHLGSMQIAIQGQHNHWLGKLKPGDVLMTNHPEWGGTHLPDITVVTPCFFQDEIVFYTASRGHHTDIGGRGITSMMPDSRELWEEGVNVPTLKIVDRGQFLEQEVRDAFDKAGQFPGCSPTRRIQDNISDLKAQISANQRGILLLQNLCDEFSLPVVHQYMAGIQGNAEIAVRDYLKRVAGDHPNGLESEDYFDNGVKLKLRITIDAKSGSAVFDFTGTGEQCWGNLNCPISITYSAVIYSIRCLINLDIPLNQGCLTPIKVIVPKGSILNPDESVAICGSTLASQRVTDTILRAFRCVAASQGCASSIGWGIGGRNPATGVLEPGWNYGESNGGGSGAGPGWHGESAVHAHSTNTRITDPEVIEKRTPVILREHVINHGTGGKGKWNGGNGVKRVIEARIPLKTSIISERRVFAPYGMEGGENGSKGRNYVWRWNQKGGMDKINLGSQAIVALKVGERLEVNTPGGGGWGKPE